MLMLLLQLIVILNSPCEWNFNVLGGVLSAIFLLFKRSVPNGIKVDNQISNWNLGMRFGCLWSTSLLNMNERCSVHRVEKNKWKTVFFHTVTLPQTSWQGTGIFFLIVRPLNNMKNKSSLSYHIWYWNNISSDRIIHLEETYTDHQVQMPDQFRANQKLKHYPNF